MFCQLSSGGGGPLTSIVGWWKEHFKELLNPVVTPSPRKQRTLGELSDSATTQAEATRSLASFAVPRCPP